MTKAKKPTPKAVVPGPRYKMNAKVYFMQFHNGKPEKVIECEVREVLSREHPVYDMEKVVGKKISFSYKVAGPGVYGDKQEEVLFGSFVEVSKAFTWHFLSPLTAKENIS